MITRQIMFIGGLLSVAGACTASAASDDERLERMQNSPQYEDGEFINEQPMSEDWSLPDLLAMAREWGTGIGERSPEGPIPYQTLSAGDFSAPSTDLAVRWFGHSTILVEIEGKRILTDPMWSKRASPVSFAGPRRFYPPLADIDDLPDLDAVVISHDHYDHLDKTTVLALDDKVDFYVPLGVGAHLERWGIPSERIHDMDWWDSVDIGGVRLVCTPSRHFSGRSLTDRNATLWASWSIIGQQRRAFFSGDTGLFHGLSEIGDRLGPFDITMLEVGSYSNHWPDAHLGPEQAVIAHRALRGDVLLPVHWSLFNMAFHTWPEPIERLRAIAARGDIRIAKPPPGELLSFSLPLPGERWWPQGDWETADQNPVWSTDIDPEWIARYLDPATTSVSAE